MDRAPTVARPFDVDFAAGTLDDFVWMIRAKAAELVKGHGFSGGDQSDEEPGFVGSEGGFLVGSFQIAADGGVSTGVDGGCRVDKKVAIIGIIPQ